MDRILLEIRNAMSTMGTPPDAVGHLCKAEREIKALCANIRALAKTVERCTRDAKGIAPLDNTLLLEAYYASIDISRSVSIPITPPPIQLKEVVITPQEEEEKPKNIVILDGNIGAGKSTIINGLQKAYDDNRDVVITSEPLHKWEKFLPIYYSDPDKYAPLMQALVATAHTDNVTEVISDPKNKNAKVFVFERDVQSCNIFAKALKLTQPSLDLIDGVVQQFSLPKKIDIPPVTRRIWVDTSPEECIGRMGLRARPGEELVKPSFLMELHMQTAEYYYSMPRNLWRVVDGSQHQALVVEDVKREIDKLIK